MPAQAEIKTIVKRYLEGGGRIEHIEEGRFTIADWHEQNPFTRLARAAGERGQEKKRRRRTLP